MCFDVRVQKASAKIQVSQSHDYSCTALNSHGTLISAAKAAGVLLLSGILQWAGEAILFFYMVNTIYTPV